MNTKIKKMNNYLLNKHNKVFVYFSLTTFVLAVIYVYFLFMSVSYTYAQEKNIYELNNLISKNVENRNLIFKEELKKESQLLSKNFVRIDDIRYIRKTNAVVVKLGN